jgi:hypothetical protein
LAGTAAEVVLHPSGFARTAQAADEVERTFWPDLAQGFVQLGIGLRPGAVGFVHGVEVVGNGVEIAVGVDMYRHDEAMKKGARRR